jgi:hypothetical protein
MRLKVDKIKAHGINVFVNRQLVYNYAEQVRCGYPPQGPLQSHWGGSRSLSLCVRACVCVCGCARACA